MRIEDLLIKAQSKHLRSEMEVFLSFLLNKSRLELIAHKEESVPVTCLKDLQLGWTRILEGCPVPYLTHQKEFYGLDFYVDERVLVPRGTTEELVEMGLDFLKELDGDELEREKLKVLELGTGSGAVALSMKATNPKLFVRAVDISEDALAVASKNCIQLGLNVELVHSDLLKEIEDEAYDLILANLPYIGTVEHAFVSDEVAKYEPDLALYGGEDGLDLYRELFKQLNEWANQPLCIMGEVGFSHGELIEKVCLEWMPAYSFELKKDLEGLDRFFILKRVKSAQ
jgi:release factor glutamine methyltransferase